MRAVQPVWEESEGQQTLAYDQLPLDDVSISNRVNLAMLVKGSWSKPQNSQGLTRITDMDDFEWNTKEGDGAKKADSKSSM